MCKHGTDIDETRLLSNQQSTRRLLFVAYLIANLFQLYNSFCRNIFYFRIFATNIVLVLVVLVLLLVIRFAKIPSEFLT